MTRFFPYAKSWLILSYALIFNMVLTSGASGQCFIATYSIQPDYSNSGLPEEFKAKLQKPGQQNRVIYRFASYEDFTYEWVDSIAHLCGADAYHVEPQSILRFKDSTDAHFLYSVQNELHCFHVKSPEHLKDWQLEEAHSKSDGKDHYLTMRSLSSMDYVLYDSDQVVAHNAQMIDGVPGLLVEAKIGDNLIKLLDVKSVNCNEKLKAIPDLEKVTCTEVSSQSAIPKRAFLSKDGTGMLRNEDFDCVQRF